MRPPTAEQILNAQRNASGYDRPRRVAARLHEVLRTKKPPPGFFEAFGRLYGGGAR